MVHLEDDERITRVIDLLYNHIALAVAHYDDVFDHQHRYITLFSPVWSKERLWENYYTPICDELEEIWNLKMDDYLKTMR